MSKQRFGNELHPVYSRWLSMNQRCNNPSSTNYRNYGAKGIKICPTLTSFTDYRDYITTLPNYDPQNLQIDRIDPHKGYERGNLRWADQSVQIANQTNSGKGCNKFTGVNWSKTHNKWVARITFKGKTLLSSTHLTECEALEARNDYIRNNDLPHQIQNY